jgi:hypothetical protein
MSYSKYRMDLRECYPGYDDATILIAHYFAYHHKIDGKLVGLHHVDGFDIHMFFKFKYYKGLYSEALFNEFKTHFYRVYKVEDDDY